MTTPAGPFEPHSVDFALSALDDINPLTVPPARRHLREVITGQGSVLLGILFGSLIALLTVKGLVISLFPKSPSIVWLDLASLLLAPVYGLYVLVTGLIEWRRQKSLVQPDFLKKRRHDLANVQKMLAAVPDKAQLAGALAELRREIDEVKDTSSSFADAVKDLSPLLLAVVAIMAISSNVKSEDVTWYPAALLTGSAAVVIAYVMRFPTYRRVRLYSYRAYIVERAINSGGAPQGEPPSVRDNGR
jgi:hypothetical protein